MSEQSIAAENPTFREVLSNSIRYWEPRRILYNAVLLAMVVMAFVERWPESRLAVNFESLLALFILAVLENVAYCAAYVPDIALQYSSLRATWLKWRFLLLAIGVLFSAALAFVYALLIASPFVD